MLSIRKSQPEDLPVLMEIFSHAREFMKDHQNPRQWGLTNWPPENLIREDIQAGRSYVLCEEGKIEGTFCCLYGFKAEPQYTVMISGQWPSRCRMTAEEAETYAVVHRLASSGNVPGIGKAALNWAFGRSHHLRVDTHPDNYVMQNLLEGLGFIRCGYIHDTKDNDPRIAYEKLEEGSRIRHILTKDQLLSHDCFEFAPGRTRTQCWGEHSVYVTEEDFQEAGLDKIFRQFAVDFSYDGPAVMNREKWQAVCRRSEEQLSCPAGKDQKLAFEIIEDLIAWASKVLEEEGSFTISGSPSHEQ